MPKIHLYLPIDLYERVKADNLNVSAILADYLRVFLDDRVPGEYERRYVPGKGLIDTPTDSVCFRCGSPFDAAGRCACGDRLG